MSKRQIYITEFDMKRLKLLIASINRFKGRDKDLVKELEEELNRGKVVPSREIPQDFITMNSRIHLKDMDSGEEIIYTLVFPGNADINQGKISILAPIGMALIGYHVGDTIAWKVPAGLRRLKVKEILYQPEAAGHYHL